MMHRFARRNSCSAELVKLPKHLLGFETLRWIDCFLCYRKQRVSHFFLVFFSPFSIAITSLGEERANLSAFRTFVRFVLV